VARRFGDRDTAPALELVAFHNLIAINNLADLGGDKLSRPTVAGLGVELIEADALSLGARREG
jgi:hypothetical protein